MAIVPALALAHAVQAQIVRGTYVPWDPVDATKNIQKAIDDAVPPARIILSAQSTPWYVSDTIEIYKDNIEFRILGGATVLAKEGGFTATNACMFRIRGNNVKMNGYVNGADASAGIATLEMRKTDYHNPPYVFSEVRHCISIQGSDNAVVQGFKLLRSGGDGITINKIPDVTPANHPSNVIVKDVICDDNYRQGMSVISVDKLTVTNSQFKDTGRNGAGTPPRTGLDIEPSIATDILKEIKFINCVFSNNVGGNVQIYLRALTGPALAAVDITFDGCVIEKGPSNGLAFYTLNPDTGPTGTILVKDTTIQNVTLSGLRFSAWGADRIDVIMSNVHVIDCGFDDNDVPVRSPILFGTEEPTVRVHGDVAFINNCKITENYSRPNTARNTLVWANFNVQEAGCKDITGSIVVRRPADSESPLIDLGDNAINCTLTVTEELP